VKKNAINPKSVSICGKKNSKFFIKFWQFSQDNIVSHIILLIILFVAFVRNVTEKKG
jgi:serine kinase of HPr protein (carbohydrate metabolism regulator)